MSLTKYKLVLGLEIHLHPKINKKMFCYCSSDIWGKEPNTLTCPVCLGLPGALPVPNREAVEKTQLLGMALKCEINQKSRFDRKHYFYPDLPKGYQISQYKQPLCVGGSLKLDNGFVVELDRIHLEEDVAKSFHVNSQTLIDFNKSGVALIEMVTKPVFTNVTDAVDFCKKVQNIIRFLEIGDVDMEKGQLRLEANVSVRTEEMENANELAPYKVEIKNINSFKFLEKAVNAEFERQVEVFTSGEIPKQENRGFNEATGKTVTQRDKEEAHDYRYFPEPDIPPMEFDDDYLAGITSQLRELPDEAVSRYESMGISLATARTIVNNFGLDTVILFDQALKKGLDPIKSANFLVNKKEIIEAAAKGSEHLYSMLEQLIKGNSDNLDEEKLAGVIDQVLEMNPKAVGDYKKGNTNSISFLVGQVMKETKGGADPMVVRKKIEGKL